MYGPSPYGGERRVTCGARQQRPKPVAELWAHYVFCCQTQQRHDRKMMAWRRLLAGLCQQYRDMGARVRKNKREQLADT